MPKLVANRSALSRVREPTAATVWPVSSRSCVNWRAMPPVPSMPQRSVVTRASLSVIGRFW
jgi:hypothetical protein